MCSHPHWGDGESKDAENKTPRAPSPEAGTATLIRGEEKVSEPGGARCLRHAFSGFTHTDSDLNNNIAINKHSLNRNDEAC